MAEANQPSFEEQLERLREITAQLEEGRVSLEKSLELYKEGVQIASECRKTLEKAKHTVQIYTEAGLEDFTESDAADV